MSEVWDKMQGWSLVLPPSRPSSEQLNNIRSRISGIDRNSEVAVLGSTPEFRDLFYELGFGNIFVFDKNINFYKEMGELRVNESKEVFVEGDWLTTLPLHKNKFSVVLSDLTSGNIEYERRGTFYSLVEDVLLPGSGLFFDKVLTNESPLLDLSKLIESYLLKPFNLQTVNYFSCEAIFCSELISEFGIVDTSRIYSRLSEMTLERRLLKFVNAAETITPRDCKWYYGRPWSELVSEYCPRLETIDQSSMPDDGPYTGRVKHFLKRKS